MNFFGKLYNHNSKLLNISFLLIATMLLSSCIPQKQIVLLQNKSGNDVFSAVQNITERYVLQPNDLLFINVTSPDPKLSVFFNPQVATGGNANTYAREFFYYEIDDSMNINFPVTGKVNLKDCTIAQAHARLYKEISNYLSDFTLIVKLASNSFSIVGEVNKQGQYTMTHNQITIFDALAHAGGFTSYAKRKEVKLIRKLPNGDAKEVVIDLTDDNIINSEYYYIYPNDILYVRPLRVKTFGFGESISFNLVTSLLTIYLLILSIKKE
ncbi:MAG: polysaccharide biosynthesis/export family protein [Bacteroidales bacterium]|nr:polysaccharide biosynthesis/export family protein [Bacteroidales bacterium]